MNEYMTVYQFLCLVILLWIAISFHRMVSVVVWVLTAARCCCDYEADYECPTCRAEREFHERHDDEPPKGKDTDKCPHGYQDHSLCPDCCH